MYFRAFGPKGLPRYGCCAILSLRMMRTCKICYTGGEKQNCVCHVSMMLRWLKAYSSHSCTTLNSLKHVCCTWFQRLRRMGSFAQGLYSPISVTALNVCRQPHTIEPRTQATPQITLQPRRWGLLGCKEFTRYRVWGLGRHVGSLRNLLS